MGIQSFSEDAILVTLPREPQSGDELKVAAEAASAQQDQDVIVDCSRVGILTSESICSLMVLERTLLGQGRKMVLCSVPPPIQQVLERVGLASVFCFAEDEASALQSLRGDRYGYG